MKQFMIFLLFPFVVLSQEDLKYYEQYMPESTCGEIVHYEHYSVSFCEEHKLSEWTIYYMTKERLFGTVSRSDDFRQDPNLNGRDASLSDYKGSGYDRGHMVPASDMKFNRKAMSESFYMTNTAPQSPSFNRGVFRKLENRFREWVFEFDSIVIITGWIPETFTYAIGPSKIPVPDFFYKIFFDIEENRAIAFILPNSSGFSSNLLDYTVSINYLESLTGINFFYKLPDDVELSLEIDTGIDSNRIYNKIKKIVEKKQRKNRIKTIKNLKY